MKMYAKSFKIRRVLSGTALYDLCNRNDYYTMGDNDEYHELFAIVTKLNIEGIDDYGIMEIANNIYNHSDVDELAMQYGASYKEVMSSIICSVMNSCEELVKLEDVEYENSVGDRVFSTETKDGYYHEVMYYDKNSYQVSSAVNIAVLPAGERIGIFEKKEWADEYIEKNLEDIR